MDLIHWKQLASFLAVCLAIGALIPYVAAVYRSDVKPHPVSWIIWGSVALVVCIAQWVEGAGVGVLPTAVTAILSFSIAALGFWLNTKLVISTVDKMAALLSTVGLILWMLLEDPNATVAILATVSLIGYYPTIRKARILPDEESSVLFVIGITRNILAALAVENTNFATTAFPISSAIGSLIVVLVIWYGRRAKSAT